jgi:MtrB/PioB family decaheme-associated outer membrane protein
MRTGPQWASVLTIGCFWCAAAPAQDEGFGLAPVEEKPKSPLYLSEVELGIGDVSDEAFHFGRYTGLQQQGLYGIGGFSILQRADYDSGKTQYFRAQASDLGLDSRELGMEYGKQGSYRVYLNYDEIPNYRFNDGRTPYLGVGSAQLTLPSSWVAANTTGGMSQLDSLARPLEISDQRKRFALGLSFQPRQRWKVDVSVKRKQREGTRETAGIFATNGGNPAAMLLPEPLDYITDEVQASLGYTGEHGQLQASYLGSFFRDQNRALQWSNAFSDEPAGSSSEWPLAGTSPYAGYPTGQGALALPPDNEAHYFTLAAGYDWGGRTRFSGQVRYGVLTQNDPFLSYTVNPNLAVPAGLPQNSLDGRIEQVLADLGVSSRLTPRLRLHATLRYSDDNNKTPSNVYRYAPNDTADQGAVDSALARINLPYSMRRTEAALAARYRFPTGTSLSGGYRYQQRERSYSEVATQREQTANLRLSGNPSDSTNGWLDYAHSWFSGSQYLGDVPFLASHTPEYLATLPLDQRFENHPALRKPISFSPQPRFSFNLMGSYRRDDYTASELGLQNATATRLSLEPSYRIGKDTDTYAYYTFEWRKHEQTGHAFQPFPVTLNSLTDPAQRWSADTTDRIDTVGLGVKSKGVLPKTDLQAEYSYSNAVTRTAVTAGAELQPAAPLPDVSSRLHHVSLSLEYHYRDNLTWRLRYIYENYRAQDYAVDGIAMASLPQILSWGQASPDYSVHLIGLSAAYRF